jgi:hypothetical protein
VKRGRLAVAVALASPTALTAPTALAALAPPTALAAPAAPAETHPYSFLTEPTDQLGVPGYIPGTTVTPDGALYTGWAELAFRFGPRLQPADGTVRDLLGGRYPVVRYYLHSGAVQYTVTTLAAAVGHRPVNFVRVTIRNAGARAQNAAWGAGLRYSGGKLESNGNHRFRFKRPVQPLREGLYTQPGVAFDPFSVWAFAGGSVTRDGQALLLFPRAPAGVTLRQTLRPGGTTAPVSESTVFGEVDYRVRLAPGRQVELDFAMPVVPVAPGSGDYGEIARATFAGQLAGAVRYWQRLYGSAIHIQVPEPKVADTFYTSLANIAIARYPAASGGWVQAVNKLQYNAFWLRDASFMANALDLAGLHGLATQDLEFFLSWQQSDGLFLSRRQQYDGFGEALWGIAEHALRTGDRGFARQMIGPVGRALNWFETERQTEPWGLMPASAPGDDELTTGHITGDNFLAADGIQAAIGMAKLAGRDDLAGRWAQDLQAFMTDLRGRVSAAETKTGGWIPPALEANGGEDWGNLWAAYPAPLLAPGDPAVTATLRHVISHFREGIATYYGGAALHDYLGFRVFETELLRGQQLDVVNGLYSELAHTTSTNGGFEVGILPHGARVVNDDVAPHGWFAAEYVALLRNMLVREDGREVALMSAVSPSWLLPGRQIVVAGADTSSGRIGYTLRAVAGGAVLQWHGTLAPGTRLVWPVPSAARDVRAHGLSRDGRTITLSPGSGRLVVRWRLRGPFPSFSATVRQVLAQYRR